MAIYDNYFDHEYTLYETLSWIMLGMVDSVNPLRSNSFAGFLEDLFDNQYGSDISGEPDWSIERLYLNGKTTLEYPFIQGKERKELEKIILAGDQEAFWIENLNSKDKQVILNSISFWKITNDSFKEFIDKYPERRIEYEIALKKYPQLSRE